MATHIYLHGRRAGKTAAQRKVLDAAAGDAQRFTSQSAFESEVSRIAGKASWHQESGRGPGDLVHYVAGSTNIGYWDRAKNQGWITYTGKVPLL